MNEKRNMRPFRMGLPWLSVISTDLAEAEALVKVLAEEEKSHMPQAFAGKEACVYFKLPYVPPCEPFKELRRLILRIRENTGLRANFKGVVAIEVTEWVGHEKEDYFTVVLKYLYDHRKFWNIAAVLNGCSENQTARFLAECSRYITPQLFPIRVFSDMETLNHLICRIFDRYGRPISPKGAELAAAALMRPELKNARSLTLILRVAEEILALPEDGKPVTAALVREYLMDACSTPVMIAGGTLLAERGKLDEKESLQLRG